MISKFQEGFSLLCKRNENREAILMDYETRLFSLSYGEILSLINKVHVQLGGHHKVLSLLPNSLQQVLYFLSSMYFGRDFCPLQCFITERELKRSITLFKPDVCLISKKLLHPSIVQLLQRHEVELIDVEEDIKLFLQQLNSTKSDERDSPKGLPGFLYLFTSGTTGAPKFLVINIDKLWSSAQNFCKLYSLDQISHLRVWNYLPMSYLGGLFNLFLIPLAAGGAFYIDESFSGRTFLNFWNQINRLKINLIWFVPSIIKGLLKIYEQREAQPIDQQVICFLGTAPITHLEKINFENKFSLKLYENYGLSETTFISAEMDSNNCRHRQERCVGRTMPEVKIQIVPSSDIDPYSNIKNIGEIYVKTPYLFEGYLNVEGLEKPKLNADGYFNTFDFGTLEENQYLYLYGRSRNIIKKGGHLIFLDEIENMLTESGLADEYVAIACNHEFYGESFNLFIKSDNQNPDLKINVQAWIQENLSKNKWPEKIITIDSIPRTPSGKIQKHLLV